MEIKLGGTFLRNEILLKGLPILESTHDFDIKAGGSQDHSWITMLYRHDSRVFQATAAAGKCATSEVLAEMLHKLADQITKDCA